RMLISLVNPAFARNDFSAAQADAEHALAIYMKLLPSDSATVARSLHALGALHYILGDLVRGEQEEQKAFDILKQVPADRFDLVQVLHGLGDIAWRRGDLITAENYFRQILRIQESLTHNTTSTFMVTALTNLAIVIRDRGDLARAEIYYHRAAVMASKLDTKDRPSARMLMSLYNSLGVLASRRGHFEKAEAYLRRSLAIAANLQIEPGKKSEILQDLGDVQVNRNDLAGAEDSYRQGLAMREQVEPGTRYHAETLGALAGVLRLKHQEQEAAKLYEQALNALENQTSHLGGGDEVRFGFRARYESYYKDYLDLLIAQNQPERAFDVLERSRSRSLAEALAAARIDIHTGVDAELLQQERSLREKLTTKSNSRIRLLGAKHTEEEVKALDKEVAELLARYQEVEEQIRLSSPAYAALTQPHPLGAQEVREHLLDEDTVLLEYSLGKERSHLFALTPTTLTSYQLPGRSEIESAARQVYELLTARNHGVRGESKPQRRIRLHSLDAAYERATAQLSRMILAPAAAELSKKRLLIVADGALAYIPFAALPSPQASASTATGPLATGHEIVNLPSASVLALLRQQEQGRKPAPKAVAVLADPVFSKDDSRVSVGAPPRHSQLPPAAQGPGETFNDQVPLHLLLRSASDTGLQRGRQLRLNRLPYTRQEATAIAAVVPADQGMQALDFRASRATAMSADLGQYRIVHFATHGLLNSRNPELSGLVLSLVDQRGQPRDGFLQLQDIYNLSLAADLVVLSACETALGKQVEGEGLIGLTRGFMYAGASRVMSSLWRVDDEATAQLMKKFYEAVLRDGRTPAAALREAQMWMRTQKAWSSPYYWAGFVLQGEWK
ncbi:MAG TPA: CHAT domain-containing protein, partial [Candidatus Angelobacter sp.]